MPFQPGHTLGGRQPSNKDFANALRIAMNEARAEGGNALRAVAQALVDKAIAGDVQAIKEFADRIDGKVPQQIGSDPENPLTLVGTINMIAYQQPLITHEPDESS